MTAFRLWAPNTPFFRGTLAECITRADNWHKYDRWIIESLTPTGWKIVLRFGDPR